MEQDYDKVNTDNIDSRILICETTQVCSSFR